ncbi:MAG: protein tyrosine phosphatase [Candidatus Heimdallarchaeota archaeon]|nr:protein tyrosine phosphatase [Candidatus Heimdallarchaeota archaeon]
MGSKPTNFSFIDSFIAGTSFPYESSHLEYFLEAGITNIVTITSETPLSLEYFDKSRFNLLHLPVNSPPISRNSIDKYILFLQNAMDNSEKVVVHCQFGQERTGILLALYLIKFKNFSAQDAIDKIRKLRPKSLQMTSSIKYLLENFSY